MKGRDEGMKDAGIQGPFVGKGQDESTTPRSCRRGQTGIINVSVGLANLRALKRKDHSVIGGSVRPTTQRDGTRPLAWGSANHKGRRIQRSG